MCCWGWRKMVKSIKNLPSLSLLIVRDSVTTNFSKRWLEYFDDFRVYLIATGITQAHQKSFVFTFSRKKCEKNLENFKSR